MRAAVFVAPGEALRLEEVESLPLDPTDVHVRVDATALCQTDAAVRRGAHDYGSPVLMGPEASGTVLAVGRHVAGLTAGDTVIRSPRSEERRVGRACVSKFRSRRSRYHSKNKTEE